MVFLQKLNVFIRFGKRVAPGWLARPAGWNTRFDRQKTSITLVLYGFSSKNLKKPNVFIRFGKRVAPGWLARPAGWNILFDFKKQVLHRFFMVFLQKLLKTKRFHAFWEAGGSGLAGSAGCLEYPFWIPKSKYYMSFSWFYMQFWILNVNFTRRFWWWHSKNMVISSRAPAKYPPKPQPPEPILFHIEVRTLYARGMFREKLN